MSKIIEEILKLPKKKKIELYYALQENLDWDDNYLAEDDLTPEQWKELDKRVADLETGKVKAIPYKEFKKKMDEKIKALRTTSASKSNA